MKTTLLMGSVRAVITNHVDHLPKGNEEFRSYEISEKAEGSGFISAAVFQYFGFPYELAAPVGTGAYADFVEDECAKRGVELNCRNQEVNGCVYRFEDQKGKRDEMIIPGGEYVFNEDKLQLLTLDEIERILIGGDLLTDEYSSDILEAAREMGKQTIVLLDEDTPYLSDYVIRNLMKIHPVLILSEEAAVMVNDQKQADMADTAASAAAKCGNDVLILSNGKGCCLYMDGEMEWIPSDKRIDPAVFTSYLLAAVAAGVQKRKAVSYSLESAGYSADDENAVLEENKKRLARVILEK